jgi:hypothetical protein
MLSLCDRWEFGGNFQKVPIWRDSIWYISGPHKTSTWSSFGVTKVHHLSATALTVTVLPTHPLSPGRKFFVVTFKIGICCSHGLSTLCSVSASISLESISESNDCTAGVCDVHSTAIKRWLMRWAASILQANVRPRPCAERDEVPRWIEIMFRRTSTGWRKTSRPPMVYFGC